jgi:hypothetical protein
VKPIQLRSVRGQICLPSSLSRSITTFRMRLAVDYQPLKVWSLGPIAHIALVRRHHLSVISTVKGNGFLYQRPELLTHRSADGPLVSH